MKKLSFIILPLIALSIFASPLMARNRLSISINFNALPPLLCPPPVVQQKVIVRHKLTPVPTYIEKRIIRKYYSPMGEEEVIITKKQSPRFAP